MYANNKHKKYIFKDIMSKGGDNNLLKSVTVRKKYNFLKM